MRETFGVRVRARVRHACTRLGFRVQGFPASPPMHKLSKPIAPLGVVSSKVLPTGSIEHLRFGTGASGLWEKSANYVRGRVYNP